MKLTVVATLLVVLAVRQGSASLPPPFTEECVTGTYPPKAQKPVPTYIVNLDLPASQRWQKPLQGLGPQIINLIGKLKSFLLEWGKDMQYVVDFIDKDMGYLADTFPYPFNQEMRSIANATGTPLGEVVLYNVFYEVFTVCTSIVAQDSNGKLYHGRNLDFGLFMGWNGSSHQWEITEALKPIIGNFEFQRGGKTVFTSVNFAGYVGILTAIKPKLFTFSMDERFNVDGGYIGILKWLLGDRSGRWMGFLTRDVLENSTSYAEAKTKLATTPMLAPAYFILGGNKAGEACVITRSRDKAVDVWDMSPSNGSWYLVETNYDHWKKPFFLDDRRTPAKNCLNKLSSKNMAFAGLYDVLNSKPVRNKLTTYTALMQVDGSLETYLQDCPDPCWPF